MTAPLLPGAALDEEDAEMTTPPDGRAGITADLVRRLLAEQFPRWAALPVRPVPVDGWDNRTYRLGDTMTVRLPTAAGYVPAVDKEHEWLPRLAPSLPVAVPTVLARGEPGAGYPYPWSVRGWLPGETMLSRPVDDPVGFAVSVGEFVVALRRCDATGGPAAGLHSFHRGGPLAHYDGETRSSLAALAGRVDTDLAIEAWERALAAEWSGPPVWFHGDIAPGNLLVADGRLSAVLDFGTSGVGDPACDLVIAWQVFAGESRRAFLETVGDDAGTRARARGWALWKAVLMLAECIDRDPPQAEVNRRVLGEVLAEHRGRHGRSGRRP
ncbi:aminoglycoside phosphotransferase [Actinocatenispora thailandica]|uniref:Aminoglycoside phosphotransferase n=1 Tax=Actinocatenispora thailandica TaxID=227318 RepID=A0A7R7HW96_9ACTN|nr:aminoglycoside phosphotransferase family protein [Actinocatenispora thailandica]BCJ33908.1 aminoglycoside phosphotransferase [Actinocatenispora thailandica]